MIRVLADALMPVHQPYLHQARQMQALSFAVHIPLVAFGISFPALVLFAEARWLRTGDPLYRALARRPERLPEPRRFRPNCSARPQDLSPRFAGAGSAISNALFSSGFRYSRPRPPRGAPPFDGGALLDRTRLRFAGSFQRPPRGPAIRLASPSLIGRGSVIIKKGRFAGI